MPTDDNSSFARFWNELKWRGAIRVTALYAIAGWIVTEVASTDLPNLNLPERSVTLVTMLVVPFVNYSGDEENEYFSDGVTEEILTLPTRLPQLRDSPRSPSFACKGEQIYVKFVADDLAVNTLLENNVRRAGDRIRTTAQLIETTSNSHLWSETCDRAFSLLDEAIANGFGYHAWLENDNSLDNLRSDPRFDERLNKLA